jgi:hypothetical protein
MDNDGFAGEVEVEVEVDEDEDACEEVVAKLSEYFGFSALFLRRIDE